MQFLFYDLFSKGGRNGVVQSIIYDNIINILLFCFKVWWH